MRHGTNRRQRNNRGSGGRRNGNGNQGRSQVFDSNGPDVRIRGTAHQVLEKYLALAKDSASSGDLIMSESYMQHAEHYQRVINSWGDDVQPMRSHDIAFSEDNAGNNASAKREDLSLPSSILGPKVEMRSQDLVTEQA